MNMNNEYMTGRDIRGNEYEMRELTDEEKGRFGNTDTSYHPNYWKETFLQIIDQLESK